MCRCITHSTCDHVCLYMCSALIPLYYPLHGHTICVWLFHQIIVGLIAFSGKYSFIDIIIDVCFDFIY